MKTGVRIQSVGNGDRRGVSGSLARSAIRLHIDCTLNSTYPNTTVTNCTEYNHDDPTWIRSDN
jgi:hypothetical protein